MQVYPRVVPRGWLDGIGRADRPPFVRLTVRSRGGAMPRTNPSLVRTAAVVAVLAGASHAQSPAAGLAPRTPLPKEPVRVVELAGAPAATAFEHRLIVKFADAARVRATSDGGVVSLA